MKLIDHALQIPFLVALFTAFFLCVASIDKYRKPAILGMIGFGILLVQSQLYSSVLWLFKMLLGDDEVAYYATRIVWNCLFASAYISLVMAVFADRKLASRLSNASAVDLDFAREQLRRGSTLDQIEANLNDRGVNPSEIAAINEHLEVQASHQNGVKILIIGIFLLTVGGAITALSSFASDKGAPVIIAYGLIFTGGAGLIRGIILLGR